MPKIQPIQREPLSTSDREAVKALTVNVNGGVRVSGPGASSNPQQAAGTKVGGATSINGSGGVAPSKIQGKVTRPN